MAHFAKLDENNLVIEINALNNNEIDPNNEEESGIAWLNNWAGQVFNWKQVSFNTRGGKRYDPVINEVTDKPGFRKNYPSPGFTYDPERDAFIPPKNYPSWVLNEETCLWEPPIPYPRDGFMYTWDEETTSWVDELPPLTL
jgi:hypothetical protein